MQELLVTQDEGMRHNVSSAWPAGVHITALASA